MTEIQQLIAAGRTEDALILLGKTSSNALLLQAQYNNGKKQYNLGLIDFTEWARIEARVNNAILDLADNMPVSSNNNNSQNKTEPMNILKQFDVIFENLQKNNSARNWSVTELVTSTERLDNIFQTTAFSESVESVQYGSFQNKLATEKNQILAQFYSDLLKQQESLRKVVQTQQEKTDNETTFQELLTSFFNAPKLKTWNQLAESLTVRFSDRTLYDSNVLNAWNGWKKKMGEYSNEFTFGLEFGNSQTKSDLRAFLNTNMGVKNHNV